MIDQVKAAAILIALGTASATAAQTETPSAGTVRELARGLFVAGGLSETSRSPTARTA